ncbi:hypothetical protein K2173_021339 [Erythroxylum novogranatense]|uniref:Transcription repressor n=1 Tax=Erythroxylum novogranatense TaxID=1862640 RepID=A0AAV8TUJ4_9ROSI|nr:hypothetical protein K2173_021339 [Erythroxylum novogranatense]
MAKRFKLRLSRVFQSCRSKDPSSLPSNPVPSFLRLAPVVDLHPLSRTPHHSIIKRQVSSAFTSIGCGLRSKSTYSGNVSDADHSKSPPPPPTPEFHWEREDKWHVIAKVNKESSTTRQKIYRNDVDVVLPPPRTPNSMRKKRGAKKKKLTPRTRISTSSADSELFSSEGFEDETDMNNEETETLVSSSKSFSTDSSSEFNGQHLETIRETPFSGVSISNRRKKVKKERRSFSKQRATRNKVRKSFESMSPARLSRFQWLIPCTVEGKVRESFAVVKKSDDPYEDFRRSMMEMILEKQMFEERDLEQLLHCFLSLNSRHHHGVIVEAFAEIWEALFFRRSSISNTVYRAR